MLSHLEPVVDPLSRDSGILCRHPHLDRPEAMLRRQQLGKDLVIRGELQEGKTNTNKKEVFKRGFMQ